MTNEWTKRMNVYWCCSHRLDYNRTIMISRKSDVSAFEHMYCRLDYNKTIMISRKSDVRAFEHMYCILNKADMLYKSSSTKKRDLISSSVEWFLFVSTERHWCIVSCRAAAAAAAATLFNVHQRLFTLVTCHTRCMVLLRRTTNFHLKLKHNLSYHHTRTLLYVYLPSTFTRSETNVDGICRTNLL